MRKYLIIILILIPSLCLGNDASSIMGKSPTALSTICGKAIADVSSFAGAGVAAAKACPTDESSIFDNTGNHDDFSGAANDTYANYVGQKFTAGSNYTICAVSHDFRSAAGTGATYQAEIYTLSGTSLDALVSGDCISDPQAVSSGGVVKFTGMSCSLTASTTYAVVITRPDHSNDGTNYMLVWWSTDDAITGTGVLWKSDKTEYFSPGDSNIKLWGFTP